MSYSRRERKARKKDGLELQEEARGISGDQDEETETRGRRGKRKKKRKKPHYILKTVCTIAVLYGLYRLAMSPIFDVEKVYVTDNAHFTRTQIIELSGIETGENIFKLKTGKIKSTLEESPYIRVANVKRDFPDAVRIEVEERTEDMLVKTASGEGLYAVINYDGMLLRFVNEGELPNLPVVGGLTPIEPEPGKPLNVEEKDLLKPALDFFENAEKEDFFFKRLELGGVVAKAYILDRLICEGTLSNIQKAVPELRKITADLFAKGVERGTISVGGGGTCSFTPELGEQLPDSTTVATDEATEVSDEAIAE